MVTCSMCEYHRILMPSPCLKILSSPQIKKVAEKHHYKQMYLYIYNYYGISGSVKLSKTALPNLSSRPQLSLPPPTRKPDS